MTNRNLTTALVAAGLGLAMLAAPAGAQFYKGKTMTMLVPVPGGSGLDLVARNFARYWAKHIPGKPTIVSRNMPGGGGVKSLNFLFDKGKPDGMVVNFGPWNAGGVIAKAPGIRFVPEDLAFIGASHMPQTTIMRTDAGSGFKNSGNIAKIGIFKVGGRGATRPLDLVGNLALDLMDATYKYVPGYRGMAKIKPAIYANEVQAGHSGYVGYYRFFRDTLIKDGKAMALWYHSDFDAQGRAQNNPSVTEFRSFHDVYKEVHGKLPSCPKWEAYKWMRSMEAQMSFTIFAPKGTPKEAVEALRKGFYAVPKDADYQASTQKLVGIEITFTPLAQGLNVLKTFRAVTPEIKAVFKEMAKKGQN